ncbi:MAG: MATE family efflux transporter, partial [Planctomycetes bacterium]|nr:MATE family efflux transporter [Planctomycetota bacterium]
MSVVTKSLPRLAAPLVVSFTLRFLFQLVDLVYASRLEDAQASVAAIGLWSPFFSVFLAIWVGLSAGFTANLSRAFGRRDEARIRELKASMRRILAYLIPSLTLGGAGFWFVVPYLDLEPELAHAFRVYATTLGLGIPLASFWSIFPDSIVKAHHDTRSTMIAGLCSTGTNVTLNTVFVFAFGWGIFGIGLATVLSRFASLAYAAHRARRLESRRWSESGWHEEPTQSWNPGVRAILVLSLPAALTFGLTALETAYVNLNLTILPNAKQALATFTVFDRMLQLSLMPVIGASVAVLPYVARNVAEGRVEEVSSNLRRTLLLGAGIALVVTVSSGLLFPHTIGRFFLRGEDADIEPAITALRLLPIAALAAIPFIILRPVFEAVGRPRAGIIVSTLRFAVFSLPLITIGVAIAKAADGDPVLGL